MLRLLSVPGEGKCKRQGSDTANVHVDNQDNLGRIAPISRSARGKSTGGERRGGLENRMIQRDIRLHQCDEKAGNQNEGQRHQTDGIGPVNQ